MDELRDSQHDDRQIHPDVWLAQCGDTEGGNILPDRRSGKESGSVNIGDHHIYAAVPARVRAASSDDRSVGSLVSLNSECSATSGSNSANNYRKNQEISNTQTNVLPTTRKQSVDNSVNSDTRTLCEHELPDVPADSNIYSPEVPSEKGLTPVTTTVKSGSPVHAISPIDSEDHVVPEPVLTRIKKDCELKEEFLKRPNLPNYLAPPPPPSSISNQGGSLDENSRDTPVLPPLASPEIDYINTPLNRAINAGADSNPAVRHYSSSQNIPFSNTPSFVQSHSEKDYMLAGSSGLPSQVIAQPNVVHGHEESSPYESLNDGRDKRYGMADGKCIFRYF